MNETQLPTSPSDSPVVVANDSHGTLSSRSVMDARLAVRQVKEMLNARLIGHVSFAQPVLINTLGERQRSEYVGVLTLIGAENVSFTVVSYSVMHRNAHLLTQSFRLSGLSGAQAHAISLGHLDCAPNLRLPGFIGNLFSEVTEALTGESARL